MQVKTIIGIALVVFITGALVFLNICNRKK